MQPTYWIQREPYHSATIYNQMQQEPPVIELAPYHLINIQKAISKCEISKILEDPSLFFLSYCITHLQNGNIGTNDLENHDRHEKCFHIFRKESYLFIRGHYNVILEIKIGIERIRTILVKSFSNPQKNLIEIHQVNKKTYIRLKSKDLPCSNIQCDTEALAVDDGIEAIIFDKFIDPYLTTLSSMLNATLIFEAEQMNTNIMSTYLYLFRKIQITWDPNAYYNIPIPLKMVPPVEDELSATAMYSLYKDSCMCDFKLVAADGSTLELHKTILYERGGNIIKNKLSPSMQSEPAMIVIHMRNYSLSVLRVFADFIYLGTKGIPLYSPLPADVNITDLLDLAYTYENQSLVNHCTNFIRLHYATPNNATFIKHLANKYENDHLMQLFHYLNKED